MFTFDLIDGRMKGTISDVYDFHCTNESCSEFETSQIAHPVGVNFPGTLECVAGICAIIDATVTQNDETTTFVGLAVLRPDFVAYQVVGLPNENSELGPAGTRC